MASWKLLTAALLAGALTWPASGGAASPDTAAAGEGPASEDPIIEAERSGPHLDDLPAFVDGFVEARLTSADVVGAAVSIVYRGEVVLARGYGHADLEADVPVTADGTLFRPGSASKTFVWTAIMQLYEQGLVDLDTDIRRYLPDTIEIPDTYQQPITLSHLMSHTPGFEDSALGHLFLDDPDAVPSLVDYLRRYQPARVRPPGALPAYSNYGVGLAGAIIANVSGEPFESYIERHLFEPLGMHSSTFREPWESRDDQPMAPELQKRLSKGYGRSAGGFAEGGFSYISHIGPAGALSSTASDMARWMLAHLNDGQLGDARILEPATARLMHSQHFTLDPEMPGLAHGFIESEIHGYRAIGHAGDTIFFHTAMDMIPELELGVFISTNTIAGPLVRSDFVRLLVERYFPAGPHKVPPPASGTEAGRPLAEYAGTYLSTRRPYTTVESLLLSGASRIAASPDGYLITGDSRLYPIGGDSFRGSETGTLVKFTSNEAGQINAMLPPFPILVLEKVGPLGNPQLRYAVLVLSAAIFVCAAIGAILRRKRPPAQSLVEKWAARLAVITGLTWLTTFVLGAVGLLPLLDDLTTGFYSFPEPAFVTALWLAMVAAVLTIVSAALLLPVWTSGNWPTARRLRHSGVVLMALATLLVMYGFDAIGVHLTGG